MDNITLEIQEMTIKKKILISLGSLLKFNLIPGFSIKKSLFSLFIENFRLLAQLIMVNIRKRKVKVLVK